MYFLGAITGSSGACSNAWTGPSGIGFFAIPPGVKSIYLQASTGGVTGGVGFEFQQATGISFQTTAARAANIDTGGIIYGPFRCGSPGPLGNPTVVSIYNTTAGTVSVRVYAGPTS